MNTLKSTVNFCVNGNLAHTDNLMNNTFWINVQPSLTREILEFTAKKIGTFLGVNA